LAHRTTAGATVRPMTWGMQRNDILLLTSGTRPRIFLAEDARVSRLWLSQVLRGAGYDVALKPDDLCLRDAITSQPTAPALFVLPIVPGDPASLDEICELQAQGLTKDAPILGVSAVDGADLDFDSLRRAGICGVVDRGSVAEDVVSRVNRMLRPPHERRRHLRASTQFQVDVTIDGETTREWVTSLSVGGLGVRSGRRIDVNTDLHVEFVLAERPEATIRADGRVTHVRESAPATWDFGMFFYPLCEREVTELHREVERLLALK
jgi:DNA-binding response OmpR family regulator